MLEYRGQQPKRAAISPLMQGDKGLDTAVYQLKQGDNAWSAAVSQLAHRWHDNLFDDYFNFSPSPTSPFCPDTSGFPEKYLPYVWLIFNDDGGFAGFVYLYDIIGGFYTASISLCFSRGVKRHVAKAFIERLFALGLHKLKAEVYASNKAPLRILRDLGFNYEATLAAETLVGGKPTDIDVYSIIKTE